MIYEIAITPEALEELMRGKDAAVNIERLENLLFPGGETHGNVLVADLASDEWTRSVYALTAKLLPAQTTAWKPFFLSLLKLCEPHERKNAILDSEIHWVQEAQSGDNADMIDFVFSSGKLAKPSNVEAISRLSDKQWTHKRFHPTGPANLSEKEQEAVFARLLRYADWCFIELPYLSSSLSNESKTAIQLVEIACKSGKLRKGPFHIDIRCQSEKYTDFAGAALPTKIDQILASSNCNRPVTVDIYTSEKKKKNRTFYAGTFTRPGAKDAKYCRRVKWRVVLPHVRIGSDEDDNLDADWTLNSLSLAIEKFKSLTAEMQSAGPPARSFNKKAFEIRW